MSRSRNYNWIDKVGAVGVGGRGPGAGGRFPVSSPSTFNSIRQHAERRLPTSTGQLIFGHIITHGFHKI